MQQGRGFAANDSNPRSDFCLNEDHRTYLLVPGKGGVVVSFADISDSGI